MYIYIYTYYDELPLAWLPRLHAQGDGGWQVGDEDQEQDLKRCPFEGVWIRFKGWGFRGLGFLGFRVHMAGTGSEEVSF